MRVPADGGVGLRQRLQRCSQKRGDGWHVGRSPGAHAHLGRCQVTGRHYSSAEPAAAPQHARRRGGLVRPIGDRELRRVARPPPLGVFLHTVPE